jgi:hypothetical protein
MGSSVDLGDFTRAFRADAKGSWATRDRAAATFERLQEYANTSAGRKWGREVTPETLSSKQTRQFLAHRLDSGISPATVRNEAAHIRRAVAGAGRKLGDLSDKTNNWSNSRLALPVAAAKEARAPISEVVLEAARASLKPEFAAVVGLQVALGLRANEAVCATIFKEWQKTIDMAAAADRPGAQIRVIEGAKGGRERFVFVPVSRFEAVRTAIATAVQVRGKNDYVIQKDNREKALQAYTNATRYAGMTGHNSDHGIRRAFAIQQLSHYEASGMSREKALARVSNDLGHGDGRGRWVETNYIGKA